MCNMITVLLVDDEEDYLAVQTEALRVFGEGEIDVIPVNNLAEALRTARNRTFDVLVTDKNLDGPRGFLPLLNFMKAEKPMTPVIINSGEPNLSVREEFECAAFNYKPDELPQELVRKIRRVHETSGLMRRDSD